MNIGWQEFLGFYTGLNVTRKEFDEKFQESRGIGEEIDDPNLSDGDGEEAKETAEQYPRFSVAYKAMAKPQNTFANAQPGSQPNVKPIINNSENSDVT